MRLSNLLAKTRVNFTECGRSPVLDKGRLDLPIHSRDSTLALRINHVLESNFASKSLGRWIFGKEVFWRLGRMEFLSGWFLTLVILRGPRRRRGGCRLGGFCVKYMKPVAWLIYARLDGIQQFHTTLSWIESAISKTRRFLGLASERLAILGVLIYVLYGKFKALCYSDVFKSGVA